MARLSKREIEEMNIDFDFSNPFAIARVPQDYQDADTFAVDLVYSLASYVGNKLMLWPSQIVLVAISNNNKVVVYTVNDRYKEWLYYYFQKPYLKYVQVFDDIEPNLIIEKMKECMSK